MPATALRERLASLGARPLGAKPPAPDRRLPEGFERVETEAGHAFRRLDHHPTGAMPPAPVTSAYFDLESTGLNGGAGTYAFAAAVARPQPGGGLELVQLFLTDPSGEPAFLHLLAQELAQVEVVASYNGACFDLPLLRTRWVMARMPGELPHPPHLDLLHLTRALLRQRLESCTLRAVEERVLRYERDDDLAGALIPEAYFEYLRRGWSPLLEPTLHHNRLDVLSLCHLHERLRHRLEGRDVDMEAADWLALGRHLSAIGRRADGWRALRNAAEMGQDASAAAGLLLAARLTRRRRAGRRAAAAQTLLAGLEAALPGRFELTVARARILEWRLRDHLRALAAVESALARGGRRSPHGLDLERRRERLLRRLENVGAGRR